MYFSSSTLKCLVLAYITTLVATQLLIRSVESLNMTNAYLHHRCVESQGKYKPGSDYEKKLNLLINSTSNGDFLKGFDRSFRGGRPDSVMFMYQCRGDSYGPKCRSCYTTALSTLRKRCPRNKGAIIWYDQCFVEISAIDTGGRIDYANICMSNEKKASGDPQAFKQKIFSFLEKLNLKATSRKNYDKNNQPVLYAAGEEMLGSKKLYAMVQCTRDLWFRSCDACLEYIIVRESDCINGKLGGRVFSTSCTFRYEFYPFMQTTV